MCDPENRCVALPPTTRKTTRKPPRKPVFAPERMRTGQVGDGAQSWRGRMRNGQLRAAWREQLQNWGSPSGLHAPQDACRASAHTQGDRCVPCAGAVSNQVKRRQARRWQLSALLAHSPLLGDVFLRAPARRTASAVAGWGPQLRAHYGRHPACTLAAAARPPETRGPRRAAQTGCAPRRRLLLRHNTYQRGSRCVAAQV